jgi:hypothetical protein
VTIEVTLHKRIDVRESAVDINEFTAVPPSKDLQITKQKSLAGKHVILVIESDHFLECRDRNVGSLTDDQRPAY